MISDLKGLSYQANNGIVKSIPMPGKDFLFLSPDEKVVEIFCSGFAPLKIILREAGIRLKSGQAWSVTITGDQKVSQADKALFDLVFTLNTEDVLVGYNQFAANAAKGNTSKFRLPAGEYSFRFSKDGYTEITEKISLSKNEALTITLLSKAPQSAADRRSLPLFRSPPNRRAPKFFSMDSSSAQRRSRISSPPANTN